MPSKQLFSALLASAVVLGLVLAGSSRDSTEARSPGVNEAAVEPDISSWSLAAKSAANWSSTPPARGIPDRASGNPKLTSHLARLIGAERALRSAGSKITSQTLPALEPELQTLANEKLMSIDGTGRVQVFVHAASSTGEVMDAVRTLGGEIERWDDEAKIVQSRVPIIELEALAAQPAVKLVRLPDYGSPQAGSVTTQGDSIHKANLARSEFNVNGSGVRVGVISDGVGGIASSQASGNLPAVNTATCNISGHDPQLSGAEGTAMLEIVHDLAPGAELWFGNFFAGAARTGTGLDFNAAVDCLAANTDIVVSDVVTTNAGPYDGTSFISANTSTELNRETNRIRAYVTSVGNEAMSHYQETYVPFSPTSTAHRFSATASTGDALSLGPSNNDPLYLPSGGTVTVDLQWNDPFGGSSNDYDLLLLRGSDGALVAFSENFQTGTQNPTERIVYRNDGASGLFGIGIRKFAGEARTFDMFIDCPCTPLPTGRLGEPYHNYNTPSSSIPNQGDAGGAPARVISAGAINAHDPGNDTIAFYSSRGPTNDGRTKPDITGIDCVSTTGAGGFPPPFCGTSAAAPHIAGIAALFLGCQTHLKAGEPDDNPNADRTATRNALLNTAIDLGAPGMDNTYGSGRADAMRALSVTPSSSAPPPPPGNPAYYHPVTPARILDTRTNTGGLPGKLGQGCVKSVQVAGVGGVPASGVEAVVFNATVTDPTKGSFLTLHPSGAPLPLASNLNFNAGQTIPNLITVKLGADGKVNVFNRLGGTHVVLDVAGWYGATPDNNPPFPTPTPGATDYGYYHPLPPKRVLDTRDGTGAPAAKVGPGGTITVDVTDTFGSGVPASGVTAVVLNATVTEATAFSYLTVFPSGAAMPVASNLNFGPGETAPNLVVGKVGGDGTVKVFNAQGSTHVIFDVAGWYGGSSGGALFRSLTPARVLDTRSSPQGTPPGQVDPGETITVDVTGVGGVPSTGITAVILNVTVTGPTSGSFLTIFPEGPLPLASNLNFDAGETVPNLVIVKVGADGNVRAYNRLGSVHVIFDVAGWYSGP
jgi:hypothetical protein